MCTRTIGKPLAVWLSVAQSRIRTRSVFDPRSRAAFILTSTNARPRPWPLDSGHTCGASVHRRRVVLFASCYSRPAEPLLMHASRIRQGLTRRTPRAIDDCCAATERGDGEPRHLLTSLPCYGAQLPGAKLDPRNPASYGHCPRSPSASSASRSPRPNRPSGFRVRSATFSAGIPALETDWAIAAVDAAQYRRRTRPAQVRAGNTHIWESVAQAPSHVLCTVPSNR